MLRKSLLSSSSIPLQGWVVGLALRWAADPLTSSLHMSLVRDNIWIDIWVVGLFIHTQSRPGRVTSSRWNTAAPFRLEWSPRSRTFFVDSFGRDLPPRKMQTTPRAATPTIGEFNRETNFDPLPAKSVLIANSISRWRGLAVSMSSQAEVNFVYNIHAESCDMKLWKNKKYLCNTRWCFRIF